MAPEVWPAQRLVVSVTALRRGRNAQPQPREGLRDPADRVDRRAALQSERAARAPYSAVGAGASQSPWDDPSRAGDARHRPPPSTALPQPRRPLSETPPANAEGDPVKVDANAKNSNRSGDPDRGGDRRPRGSAGLCDDRREGEVSPRVRNERQGDRAGARRQRQDRRQGRCAPPRCWRCFRLRMRTFLIERLLSNR